MANNIQVPAGSGGDPAVATTERAGGEHAQHVRIDGGSGTATSLTTHGQKAKANSIPVTLPTDQAPATLVTGIVEMSVTTGVRIAARASRRSVVIQNLSNIACWFGPAGVETTDGFRLPGVDGATITFNGVFAIHGRSVSGTPQVCYKEEYD